MPMRDPPPPAITASSPAEKTSNSAVSAVRNWWNRVYQENNPTSNNFNTEKENLAERRQLPTHLSQALRTRQLLVDFDGGRPILRLREPLDLVNFPSVLCPRWPIECEVISDVIHHIEWEPPEAEPFYQPTGQETAPMSAGGESGTVVYCIDQALKCPYFTCSRVGGSRGPIKPAVPCDVHQRDLTLEFESRFESGNLQKAVQVGAFDYELTLSTDMYTSKYTQWFYFRVRKMKAGTTYRFTIVNLMKSSSLYSKGMRPLLYSERAATENGVGWHRTGSDIKYFRNSNQTTKDNNGGVVLHSLTWTLHFPYGSDTCYLAHCYPYTYSRLQHYLRHVSSNPAVTSYCKLRVLCRSLAGNSVFVLTVTSCGGSCVEGKTKKAVVVTARVHPGETNGSWMMEGFLDFLLGDSNDAKLLRDTFVFKVVPMLNPDGVVVGNYRCSLAGRDLNRNYKTILKDSFPCVWHTRNMVERLMVETDVVLYCDFHGHNRKNNVFMYGCNNKGEAALKLHERVFPLMMSKNASSKFSFQSCKFRVQKSKEGTGRIAMWRLGIRNSYTMEATFGGSTLGDKRGTHFTTQDLKSLGFCFCDTLLDYCDPDPTKTTYCLTELAAAMRKEVRERLGKDLGTDCNISVSDLETSTSGSNSTDSDGLPVHLLKQPADPVQPEQPVLKKKKKRLRTRKDRDRLRQERGTDSTEQKEVNGSVKNVEPNLSHGNTIKMSVQEKTVTRLRKRQQGKNLVNQAVIPPDTTQLGGLSHVTLWQGAQPVKKESVESRMSAYLSHRAKGCPHFSIFSPASPHIEDLSMDTGRCNCSSQLLHLRALLPPEGLGSTQLHCNRPLQSFVSYKIVRGRLAASLTAPHRSHSFRYFRPVPAIVPSKCLISGFANDKINTQNLYLDRRFSHYILPESSCTSRTNSSTNTKHQSEERKEDDAQVGLSLLREISPLRETEPDGDVFLPVPKASNLRARRLCKEKGEEDENRDVGIILPRPMTSGLLTPDPASLQSDVLGKLQKLVQAKDISLWEQSGRESQGSAARRKGVGKRPPQSAPL
ncbi:cytosolic carboxypeptidase 2 [Genypterus blacodes]|uniref:cytosolic carboxypeptidase 2 n=1 Tax=Genypterus blacodes TaxID=154954 RepID=UPI003F765C60